MSDTAKNKYRLRLITYNSFFCTNIIADNLRISRAINSIYTVKQRE